MARAPQGILRRNELTLNEREIAQRLAKRDLRGALEVARKNRNFAITQDFNKRFVNRFASGRYGLSEATSWLRRESNLARTRNQYAVESGKDQTSRFAQTLKTSNEYKARLQRLKQNRNIASGIERGGATLGKIQPNRNKTIYDRRKISITGTDIKKLITPKSLSRKTKLEKDVEKQQQREDEFEQEQALKYKQEVQARSNRGSLGTKYTLKAINLYNNKIAPVVLKKKISETDKKIIFTAGRLGNKTLQGLSLAGRNLIDGGFGKQLANFVDKIVILEKIRVDAIKRGEQKKFWKKLGNDYIANKKYADEAVQEAVKDPTTYLFALTMASSPAKNGKPSAGVNKLVTSTAKPPTQSAILKAFKNIQKTAANIGTKQNLLSNLKIYGKGAKFRIGGRSAKRSLKNKPLSKAQKRKGVTRAGQKELKSNNKGTKYETSLTIQKERVTQQPKPTDNLNVNQLKRLYQTLFNKKAPNVKKAELKRVLNRELKTKTPDFNPFSKVKVGLSFSKKKTNSGTPKTAIPKINKKTITQTAYEFSDSKGIYALRQLATKGKIVTKRIYLNGKQVKVKNLKTWESRTLRNYQKGNKKQIDLMNLQKFQKQTKRKSKPSKLERKLIRNKALGKKITSTQQQQLLKKLLSKRQQKFIKNRNRLKESRQKRVKFDTNVEVNKFFSRSSRLTKRRLSEKSTQNFQIKAEVTKYMRQLNKDVSKAVKPKSKKTIIKKGKTKTTKKTIIKKGKSQKGNKNNKVIVTKSTTQIKVQNTFTFARGTISRQQASLLNKTSIIAGVKATFSTISGVATSLTNAVALNQKQDIKYLQEQVYDTINVEITKAGPKTTNRGIQTSSVRNFNNNNNIKTRTGIKKIRSGGNPKKKEKRKNNPEILKIGLPKLPKSVKNPSSYDVYVRRSGKYYKANGVSLTKAGANKFGKFIVNNSVRASYFVVGTGLKARKTPKYITSTPNKYFRVTKTKSKLKSGSIVEKRKYRINTKGEKSGLSVSQLLSRARRKKTTTKKRKVTKKKTVKKKKTRKMKK